MQLGFIGLGTMGAPMVLNLLKAGHRVRVWNRSSAPLEALAKAGAEAVQTPALAAQAEVLISMLGDDTAIRSVFFDAKALHGLRAGSVHVNMSTVSVALARELAVEVRVLCFDELFVNDIGDAIILGRLFQVMFDEGVVIVCTSNLPPDDLYADGFNRDRFVPAIAAIKAHMQVVAVNGAEDHRLHPGAGLQRYFVANQCARLP